MARRFYPEVLDCYSFFTVAFTSMWRSWSWRGVTVVGLSVMRQAPLAGCGKAMTGFGVIQDKPNCFLALLQGISGLESFRSMA